MIIKRNIIFSLEKRKKHGLEIVENLPIQVSIIYAGDRVFEFGCGDCRP